LRQRLLEKRAKAGKPTPALENKPELFEGLITIWQAFEILHKRRAPGVAPVPLQSSEVMTWLKDHVILTFEERLEWEELILALDDAWVYWMRTRDKRKGIGRHGNSTRSDRRKKS